MEGISAPQPRRPHEPELAGELACALQEDMDPRIQDPGGEGVGRRECDV